MKFLNLMIVCCLVFLVASCLGTVKKTYLCVGEGDTRITIIDSTIYYENRSGGFSDIDTLMWSEGENGEMFVRIMGRKTEWDQTGDKLIIPTFNGIKNCYEQ